jgi:hypothetical protein
LRQWRRSKLARARGPHAAEWLKGYERAWRTPGTAALAELFTEDAAYLPLRTRIRTEGWRRSERCGTPRGSGAPKGSEYRDLWIVRLNEAGLCLHFEEWPFWPPGQKGARRRGRVTLCSCARS